MGRKTRIKKLAKELNDRGAYNGLKKDRKYYVSDKGIVVADEGRKIYQGLKRLIK